MKKAFICDHCGKTAYKEAAHINRSRKQGNNLYCNRKCSGLGRRKNLTNKEKKQRKAEYDQIYREENKEMLKRKKAAWFQQYYNPEKAAEKRAQAKREKPEIEAKRREYMASPEYRCKKKKYDRKYRAVQKYGVEWGECLVLVLDIRDECLSKLSAYEIRKQSGILNKTQQRKRAYEKLNSKKPEIGPLGNLERT